MIVSESKLPALLGVFLPDDVVGMVLAGAGKLKVSDNDALLAGAMKRVGIKDEDTASKLISLVRSHASDPNMTFLDFLKSPDFMTMLAGKEPTGTQMAICPHCNELILP